MAQADDEQGEKEIFFLLGTFLYFLVSTLCKYITYSEI